MNVRRTLNAVFAFALAVSSASGGTFISYDPPIAEVTAVVELSGTESFESVSTPFAEREGGTLHRVREALNTVGGGNVDLVLTDEPCGNERITACVEDDDTIYLRPDVAAFDDETLLGLMAHEFAHVVSTVWVSFDSTWKTYTWDLFDGDLEAIADCMAVERVGYSSSIYGTECTDEQVVAAAGLWEGNWDRL